jgi:CheY-like chemotaxis protein
LPHLPFPFLSANLSQIFLHHRPFDAIVTQVRMPKISGIQLVGQLHRRGDFFLQLFACCLPPLI